MRRSHTLCDTSRNPMVTLTTYASTDRSDQRRAPMSNLARLLKESWTLVEEHQDKLASYFYARMFLSNPQLRDLFPVQMDVQRARLLGAIVTAVQSVDDPERF